MSEEPKVMPPTPGAFDDLAERLWNAANDPNSGCPPHIVELLQDALDAIPRAALGVDATTTGDAT